MPHAWLVPLIVCTALGPIKDVMLAWSGGVCRANK